MNLPPCLLASLGKGFEEVLAVDIVQKDILPSIASAHNMVHRPGILNANLPRNESDYRANQAAASR
jgi:hypothetical protein